MNLKSLGAAIDLDTAAAQTAIDLDGTTPYAEGFTAVGVITQLGATGSPVAKIQTSPDNSTWTDVVTMTGLVPTTMAEVTLQRYVRANVSTAGSAGAANFYLLV
jgi:hypothetical protein